MSLPSTYADRNCSLARALEVVGERWTLLVVRDGAGEYRLTGKAWGDSSVQADPVSVRLNAPRRLLEAL